MDNQPLEHLGRQPREAQEAADVTVGQALIGGEIGKRGDVAAFQPLPPAPCPADGAQQVGILPAAHGGLDILVCNHAHGGDGVDQLRGEAGRRQVERARTAVVHGNGGTLSSQCTALLGTRATL